MGGGIMSTRPYLKFFVGDFLSDTMALSTEEIGAYCLLLFHQWGTDAAIPPSWLHKVARMSPAQWAEIEPCLEHFFSVDERGHWYNQRLQNEIADFHASAMKRKRKAAHAARSRWDSDEKGHK